MSFEFVETRSPHLSVRFEPDVELDERFGGHAVQATLAIGANAYETGLAKDTQVFGDRGLTEGQSSHEDADGVLSTSQLVEDETSRRFRDRVEC
jgi:hypothetical protein